MDEIIAATIRTNTCERLVNTSNKYPPAAVTVMKASSTAGSTNGIPSAAPSAQSEKNK